MVKIDRSTSPAPINAEFIPFQMTLRRRNDVDPVTIMIDRWERDLILRYGYPFEDIERQLRESGDADPTRVVDVPYWWEQMIINLRISEKEQPEFHADEALAAR
jgi:hypothetical protein